MLLRFRISRMRDAIFLKLHEALQGKKSTKIRKGCSEHRMNTTGASGTSSLACLSGCSGHTLPCSEPWYSVAQNCPILCNPMDCHPPGPSVHEIFPSKNIGLGCHFLLQGIFPTQRLNPHLMHWQLDFFFYHCAAWEASPAEQSLPKVGQFEDLFYCCGWRHSLTMGCQSWQRPTESSSLTLNFVKRKLRSREGDELSWSHTEIFPLPLLDLLGATHTVGASILAEW